MANMSKQDTQDTWLSAVGSLTQARVQITLSRSNFFSGCDVTVDVAAGTLWVYYQSTDPVSADVIADTDGATDLPRLHVMSAGADAHQITKFRYRFAQTMADAGAWSGTPIGTTVYRLPPP